MLLGCHLSISGGLDQAITQAEELGINALQIFSHNARSWRISSLQPQAIQAFTQRRKGSPIKYFVIHTSYLINLASLKEEVYRKSIEALRKEVERAGQLGIPQVNTHVGAHGGAGIDSGLKRVVQALDKVLQSPEAQAYPQVMILLENDAGEGTSLGVRFEELGFILDNVRQAERLGVCFDTCHGYAAGYDFTSPKGLAAMLDELENEFSLERLKLIHVNDSKHPLGSRRDRHEHIGRGHIGLAGFQILVTHARLRDLPFILETPKADDESETLDSKMDRMNLDTLRSLRAGNS
jgi:deoxyribonuclease-4